MNNSIILKNNCINHGYRHQSDRSNKMHVNFINDGIYKPYHTGLRDVHLIHCNRPMVHSSTLNTNQIGGDVFQINDVSDVLDLEIDKMNNLIDSPSSNQSNQMIGGSKTSIFRSGYTMYMIADATDQDILNAYQYRLDKLGIIKKEQIKIKPHISLMHVQINKANLNHLLMVGSDGNIISSFERELNNAYKIISPHMHLISRKGKYEIMGEFMAKVYKVLNSSYITTFRMIMYKYLEKHLGASTRKIATLHGKKYFVYAYRGQDLIAVPEYFHGKGVWTPHMSLIKLDKLKKANPNLYNLYLKKDVKILINALAGVSGSLDQVSLGHHFGSFRISVV